MDGAAIHRLATEVILAGIARQREATVVAITEQPDSSLGRLADIVLQATAPEGVDPFGMVATGSSLISSAPVRIGPVGAGQMGSDVVATTHEMRGVRVVVTRRPPHRPTAHHGPIDTHATARAEGLLPIGLANGARVTRPVAMDTPITSADVGIRSSTVYSLRQQKDRWSQDAISEDELLSAIDQPATD